MVKYYFLSIIICLITVVNASAQTAEVKNLANEDPFVFIEMPEFVMDTLETKAKINQGLDGLKREKEMLVRKSDLKSQENDSLNNLIEHLKTFKKFYSEKSNECSQFRSFIPNIDKIKDPTQKRTLKELFDVVIVSDKANLISCDSIVNIIYINPANLETLLINFKPKQYELGNVKKDIEKGKLSIPVIVYLQLMSSAYNELEGQVASKIKECYGVEKLIHSQTKDLLTNIKTLTKKINDISSNDDYALSYYQLTGSNDYPKKEIMVKEKIRNEYYRPFGEDNSNTDKLLQTKGWEWVNDNLDKKTIYYPKNITYMFHPDYPSLRIMNNCVYDSTGTLVRVLSYSDAASLVSALKTSYINNKVIEDYKNNKYNILNQSSDVQYALKNLLGLSSEHKSKTTNLTNQINKTLQNPSNKRGMAAQSAAKKTLGLFFEQRLLESRLDNRDARNFINQCKEDHKDEFGKLWKVDRINDVSFLIFIYDEKLDNIRKYKIIFNPDKPYEQPSSHLEEVHESE